MVNRYKEQSLNFPIISVSYLQEILEKFEDSISLYYIYNADNIIVIDDGEIKEMGTHDELMEKNGVYARLCAIQFQSLPGNNGA